MPRRAIHLREHCLKVPRDAFRTAENGSRFGSRSVALAPCTATVDARVPPRGHGTTRASITLTQYPLGVAACQQREDTTPLSEPNL